MSRKNGHILARSVCASSSTRFRGVTGCTRPDKKVSGEGWFGLMPVLIIVKSRRLPFTLRF